jgi:Flp pilus assembly protein TadB
MAWERWLAAGGTRIAATGVAERFESRRRHALRAADVSIAALATRTLWVTIVAALTTLVSLTVATTATVVPPWLLAAGPPAVAGLAGWYQVSTVLAACERRYREFRAGVATYVQLVSVCMTTRRSMSEAVTYAADVGVGPAFETIAAAVHAAPQMGIRVWEALDSVGAEYGCREMQDLASSVGHVSRIGVGVETTVAAVATRMRQVALDDMQRTADRQTSTMFGPTMVFVLGVVAFLTYPLAVRVLDAFSTPTI